MPLTREHAAVALDSVIHLLSRPNIHTIDVLPKTVRGEQTAELAIVVTVTNKKPLHHLDDDDYPIPKAIEVPVVDAGGRLTTELVPTDVIEGPPIRDAALDDKVRPTVGGYMISVAAGWFTDATGTLGVNMQYNGALEHRDEQPRHREQRQRRIERLPTCHWDFQQEPSRHRQRIPPDHQLRQPERSESGDQRV